MNATIAAMSSPVATNAARRRPAAIGALFIASGASGLMLEVVWSRMLGRLLGATTWSVMAILVAFMGGLGLGGLLWGRRASRSARALRLFGLMEVAIGLYSLAVPLLFEGLGRLLVVASHLVGESPAAAITVRVITAVLALAPPTLLMGGTLPVLAVFAAGRRAERRRIAGWLYAANTAGAVLGCFVAGCFLIPRIGVVETNLVAALVDLGVGTAALAWDRRRIATPRDTETPEEPVGIATGRGAALLIATLSGLCGMAYEVLWSRGLVAAITDDTTYAFTLMLTAFLAGHALGAAAAEGEARTPPGPRLAAAREVSGARGRPGPALAPDAGGPQGADQSPIDRRSDGLLGRSHPDSILTISLAVIAAAAACSARRLLRNGRSPVREGPGRPVGASTGRIYGLNTMGAIAGAVVTTAWLIPALGAQGAAHAPPGHHARRQARAAC